MVFFIFVKIKNMKTIFSFIVLFIILVHCASPKVPTDLIENKKSIIGDTIKIVNEALEYEITIIDVGFNSWFYGNARPRGYYSQQYLEARNRQWVIEYNQRVMQPMRFNPNLYMMSIDYQSNIDYGYEVNYMLFNYLVYFQQVNRQSLGGFSARP